MSRIVVIKSVFLLLAILCAPDLCHGWDQAELDLFDLVEELGENFYDVLHVDQSASAAEIKRSFRQLSLQLHPDKNDDPDATEKFRKVVAVAEVLKDPQLRERYDRILVEGLPDWKMPIFYYRRVRKMGLLELTALLMVIGSVGQYLFGLAVYVEKKLVMQDVLSRKQNKLVKKSKTAKASASSQRLEAELSFLNQQATASIPKIHNLLPFWLAKKVIALAKYTWSLYCQWRHSTITPTNAKKDSTTKEESSHEEPPAKTSKRTVRGVNGGLDKSKGDGELDEGSSKDEREGTSSDDGTNKVKRRRGKWVPEELRALTRQSQDNKPYVPPAYYCEDEEQLDSEDEEENGTSSSELDEATQPQNNSDSVVEIQEESSNIEEVVNSDSTRKQSTNRTQERRSKRSKRVKDLATVWGSDESHRDETMAVTENFDEDATDMCTSDSGVMLVSNDKDGTASLWSRYQQKQLEWALVQYPKFAKDRWENIAKAVPGKTKEECIERFKELCNIVKNKKESRNSGAEH